jgi:ribonuclease P protein component
VNYVFPSSHRIRQSKEFERAFSHKGLTNKWFTIYFVDSNLEFPRLGMVVSKRTMSKSVSRNFAKRLIRETFRLNSDKLLSRDYFVRVRRNLTKNTTIEARDALINLMLNPKV